MAQWRVEHSVKNLFFFIQMADSSKAVLEYRKLPGQVLEMYHTEVPINHRGKGLAETLVRGAFRYCLDNDYRIYPTCSYVQKFGRELATEGEKKIIVDKLENTE